MSSIKEMKKILRSEEDDEEDSSEEEDEDESSDEEGEDSEGDY